MKKQIKKLVLYSGLISTLFGGIKLCNLNKVNNQFKNEVKNHTNDNKHDGNVVAHRGFSSMFVENSKEAILEAFNCDCVDVVEIDVRMTKDNKIVVIHDSYINLLSNGCGKVETKTLKELESYKYTQKQIKNLSLIDSITTNPDGNLIRERYIENENNNSSIITLENLLTEIDNNKTLIIDIKFNENENDMIENLNEILINYNNLNIKLQSCNEEALTKMKEKYPNYNYQLIISKQKQLKYLELDYNSFAIKETLITNDLVNEQLKKGNTIMIWTINDYKEYQKLYSELGNNIEKVNIITNYPDEMCYINNNQNKVKELTKK